MALWDQIKQFVGGQTDLEKRQANVTANAQARQAARQQPQGGQGGWGGSPNYGYGGYGTPPNAWTPTPFAQSTPYAQSMIAPASLAAGASQYGSAMGLLGDIGQQPWNLAQVSQAVVPQAQASMYGAQQGALGDMMSAFYPAAANVQTAHFPAWGQAYQAGMGANLNRDLMQMGNEAKSANLYQMLQGLAPMIQRASQPGAAGMTTDYGGGFTV